MVVVVVVSSGCSSVARQIEFLSGVIVIATAW